MQKWEYKKIWREMDFTGFDTILLSPGFGPMFIWKDLLTDDTNRFAEEIRRLDQLGQEGWELAAVMHEESGRTFTDTYYLKRPV